MKPKEHQGLFSTESLRPYYGAHVDAARGYASSVDLLGVVALASFLDPTFYEVDDSIFWSEDTANGFAEYGFDDDVIVCERENNYINLFEFSFENLRIADDNPALVQALGVALKHFWGIALRERFPDRKFILAVVTDIPGEDGHPCFTFWQDRS